MRSHTSRFKFVGVAPSWGTSPTALERASRPLKEAGLWPTGYPGRGPAGDGIGAAHLAALLLGQAGDQPSDSLDAYRALASLPAENGNRLVDPGFAGNVVPVHGTTLASWLGGIIDRFSQIDGAVLNSIEANLEMAGWSLSLALQPACAFISWTSQTKAHRIDFLPLQAELLGQEAPRRISKVTVVPFGAIAAAARVQADFGGSSTELPVSQSGSAALADTDPETENAAFSLAGEAAQSSENEALTVEPGRSAQTTSRVYPILREPRKRRDSDSVVMAKLGKATIGVHVSPISP